MGLREDEKLAIDICNNRIGFVPFRRIYTTSNEQLDAVFRGFDLKDKDILSVLGSSDHVFSEYYLGAKSVTAFDVNELTKYYYYLRKWSLIYRGVDVPYGNSKEWFLELLSEVSTKSELEEEALSFWKYLNRKASSYTSKLFMGGISFNRRVPYENDLEGMTSIIEDRDIDFSKINVFDFFDYDRTFDVVVLSNILDYASTPAALATCRDNLVDHLSDNGIVICSYVLSIYGDNDKNMLQKDIFSKSFEVVEGSSYSNPFHPTKLVPASYVYVKK